MRFMIRILPRINRNIVECKYNLNHYINASGKRINRNIVECKCKTSNNFIGKMLFELIETLWNVNVMSRHS